MCISNIPILQIRKQAQRDKAASLSQLWVRGNQYPDLLVTTECITFIVSLGARDAVRSKQIPKLFIACSGTRVQFTPTWAPDYMKTTFPRIHHSQALPASGTTSPSMQHAHTSKQACVCFRPRGGLGVAVSVLRRRRQGPRGTWGFQAAPLSAYKGIWLEYRPHY